jgi:glyoxylase-like metal-dependent hydrolase (beta-lactamase superfamily II)
MTVEEPTPPPPITPGVARALSPLLRRIARSGDDGEPGLNTYLVGIDEIVIVDPGPVDDAHLDVLCGCGGDRIRWIVMSDTSEYYAAGARKLKKMTGAKLVAPAGFDGVDEVLGDGYKIDATEFRIIALAMGKPADDKHIFVLEQERCMLIGDHLNEKIPEDLPAKVKSYRLRTLAPGHGQYIEDAKAMLGL